MKKVIAILLTLSVLVATVTVASAQIGTDSITHNTSWTFQNLGTATADVSVELYNSADGTVAASDTFTVTTSASFWAPDYPPLGTATFNGSLVASSSQPLASISNQVAANGTSGRTGNATYMGFTADSVAPTMYAPVVMKSFAGIYWTEISIQSTATSGSTLVDVTYYNADGSVAASNTDVTVYAGAATRLAQEDESGLLANFNGSVMVAAQDGTTDLALIVNEFYGTDSNMYNQFYSYEGFAAGAQSVVLPAVFVDGYGGLYNASASVMNLAGPTTPANVTWHFYDANVATEVYSFTEVITTAKSVYFPAEAYASTLMAASLPADEWVGSVTLESDQDLVSIVNELSGSMHAASYTGLMGGDMELFFPLAFVGAYGFADTSFSIADVSGTSGAVTVTVYYIADTTACPGCSDWDTTYSFSVSDSQYQPTHIDASALSGGVFVGSIRITANKNISGIMNELMGAPTAYNFTSFNAFIAP